MALLVVAMLGVVIGALASLLAAALLVVYVLRRDPDRFLAFARLRAWLERDSPPEE